MSVLYACKRSLLQAYGLTMIIYKVFLITSLLQDLIKEYVGKNVIVSVQDVSQEHNRFVGNMLEASKNNAYSRLKVIPMPHHSTL